MVSQCIGLGFCLFGLCLNKEIWPISFLWLLLVFIYTLMQSFLKQAIFFSLTCTIVTFYLAYHIVRFTLYNLVCNPSIYEETQFKSYWSGKWENLVVTYLSMLNGHKFWKKCGSNERSSCLARRLQLITFVESLDGTNCCMEEHSAYVMHTKKSDAKQTKKGDEELFILICSQ